MKQTNIYTKTTSEIWLKYTKNIHKTMKNALLTLKNPGCKIIITKCKQCKHCKLPKQTTKQVNALYQGGAICKPYQERKEYGDLKTEYRI